MYDKPTSTVALDDIVKVIKDVGFPIGVAIYLLVRFDRLMTLIIASQAKELEVVYQLRDYMLYDRQRHPREVVNSHPDEPSLK